MTCVLILLRRRPLLNPSSPPQFRKKDEKKFLLKDLLTEHSYYLQKASEKFEITAKQDNQNIIFKYIKMYLRLNEACTTVMKRLWLKYNI